MAPKYFQTVRTATETETRRCEFALHSASSHLDSLVLATRLVSPPSRPCRVRDATESEAPGCACLGVSRSPRGDDKIVKAESGTLRGSTRSPIKTDAHEARDRRAAETLLRRGVDDSYLVDPASSHMLVSKIKPCMSKCKPN